MAGDESLLCAECCEAPRGEAAGQRDAAPVLEMLDWGHTAMCGCGPEAAWCVW